MSDYKLVTKWFGGGCGFIGICNQYESQQVIKYLANRSYISGHLNAGHPHNSVAYKFVGRDYEDFLDPLIKPLVKAFRELGIETIASCQGRPDQSPYIFFYANMDQLLMLNNMLLEGRRNNNEGSFWTLAAIIMEGERDDGATFVINFYDVLEMLRISEEVFGCIVPRYEYPKYIWKPNQL